MSGPWQGAAALGREETAFQHMLEADERIIWTWVEGGGGALVLPALLSRAPDCVTDSLPVIALGSVMAASFGAMLEFGEDGRRQMNIVFMIAGLGMTIFGFFLLLAPEGWRRSAKRAVAQLDEWNGGISGRGTLHALTQHRLLSTRSGALSAIPLEPGEPVIQYGKLRIDRPNRRGRPLIERIPMPEQHRLFAALQRARAIREGREA